MELTKENTNNCKRMDVNQPENSLIGRKVFKSSLKPFKSGSKIATIKGFAIHQQTGRVAFTFEEDNTQVECWRCCLLNEVNLDPDSDSILGWYEPQDDIEITTQSGKTLQLHEGMIISVLEEQADLIRIEVEPFTYHWIKTKLLDKFAFVP